MVPFALAMVLAAASLASAPRHARAVDLGLTLGGGTVLPWSAAGEVGNTFGGGVLVGLGDLELGLVGAVVLPDSRVQARFGAIWVEARLHPFGRGALVGPYAVAGFGLATGDALSGPAPDPAPPRWTSGGPTPLAQLGVGVRYGLERGLGLAVDARLYNHTHSGINVLASYRF